MVGEAGHGRELGAGEDVIRRDVRLAGGRIEGDQHEVGLQVVEPAVPLPDRERVIRPDLVLLILALLGDLLVCLVVGRAGIDGGLHGERRAIGAELRRASAGGEGGDAPRLAAVRDVEQIDLRHVVALALGREGDGLAVRRPRDVRLGRLGVRDLPRRRAAVDRHQPEVGALLLLVIRRLGHGGDDPLAVLGLGTGAPTRFISQSASCVGAFLAGMTILGCAEASADRVTARARAAVRWRCMGEMVT